MPITGPNTATFVGGGVLSASFCYDDVITTDDLLLGELRLRSPFPVPVLDEFRRRALSASTTSSVLANQGRGILSFAVVTELHSIFDTLMDLSGSKVMLHLCTRQRAVVADTLLVPLRPLYEAAMNALNTLGLPTQFQELLRTFLASDSFTHRVSAVCAIVWLSGILFQSAGV